MSGEPKAAVDVRATVEQQGDKLVVTLAPTATAAAPGGTVPAAGNKIDLNEHATSKLVETLRIAGIINGTLTL